MCKSCASHVQVMCKSCASHVQVMFKSCSSHVQVMFKSCSSHVQVMYKSCQFSHRLGDWTVFSLVSSHHCVIFAEFWFSRPRKHLIWSISTGTVGHMTNCTRRELYLKWFEKIESNLWWPSYPRCSWSHDQLYQAWTVLQMIWKNRIKFMMTVLS